MEARVDMRRGFKIPFAVCVYEEEGDGGTRRSGRENHLQTE